MGGGMNYAQDDILGFQRFLLILPTNSPAPHGAIQYQQSNAPKCYKHHYAWEVATRSADAFLVSQTT